MYIQVIRGVYNPLRKRNKIHGNSHYLCISESATIVLCILKVIYAENSQHMNTMYWNRSSSTCKYCSQPFVYCMYARCRSNVTQHSNLFSTIHFIHVFLFMCLVLWYLLLWQWKPSEVLVLWSVHIASMGPSFYMYPITSQNADCIVQSTSVKHNPALYIFILWSF